MPRSCQTPARHRRTTPAGTDRNRTMKLNSEAEFSYSCELIARMFRQIQETAEEHSWAPETREDVIIGIENARNRIKREVYEYLQHEYAAEDEHDENDTERQQELVA